MIFWPIRKNSKPISKSTETKRGLSPDERNLALIDPVELSSEAEWKSEVLAKWGHWLGTIESPGLEVEVACEVFEKLVSGGSSELAVLVQFSFDTEISVDSGGDCEQIASGFPFVIVSGLETNLDIRGVVVNERNEALGEINVSGSLVSLISVDFN